MKDLQSGQANCLQVLVAATKKFRGFARTTFVYVICGLDVAVGAVHFAGRRTDLLPCVLLNGATVWELNYEILIAKSAFPHVALL